MVKAVVGANWGDEGKGKITDMLAEQADIIVRFQGGANAGHTIINDYGICITHTSIRSILRSYNQYYRKWCSTGCTGVIQGSAVYYRSGSSDAEDSGI